MQRGHRCLSSLLRGAALILTGTVHGVQQCYFLQLFTLADFSRISLSRAISYTVGFVTRKRPFSTEAQIGLSYSRKRAFSTQLFSTEFSDWGIEIP